MSDNFYDDDLAKAGEYLRLSIGLMGQHKIPVSPLNYRLSYDYTSGKDYLLNASIDELLKKESPPTTESLNSLYRKFYLQDNESLERLRKGLSEIVTNIQGDFDRSESNLGNYSDRLAKFAALLADQISPENLSAEVDRVITDTRETEQSQRHMQNQLKDLTAEMEVLKTELIQVKQASLIDGLTGVSNRKAFDESLQEAMTIAQQEQSPYVLLMLDVDHFKAVNDNHGHIVGDKVLRFIASAAKRCIKGKDVIARYGGEEFAVILKDTDMLGGNVVAEEIRSTIAAGVLRDTQTQKAYGRVTISIGMTQFMATDTVDGLVGRADQALYRAKENGRNRIEKAA